MIATEDHPFVSKMSSLLNDPRLDVRLFEKVSAPSVFRWVATYVVTLNGDMLVMRSSPSERKYKLQAFGGGGWGDTLCGGMNC